MKLGDRFNLLPPARSGVGIVVDIFSANITPRRDLVIRYYMINDDELDQPPYKDLFKRSPFRRWVLQREGTDSNFIVVPETRAAFALLQPIHELPLS